jgi:hypothetical protein
VTADVIPQKEVLTFLTYLSVEADNTVIDLVLDLGLYVAEFTNKIVLLWQIIFLCNNNNNNICLTTTKQVELQRKTKIAKLSIPES